MLYGSEGYTIYDELVKIPTRVAIMIMTKFLVNCELHVGNLKCTGILFSCCFSCAMVI